MAAATVEICADSVAGARVAAKAGAHRVELCADLIEGGITPSYGLIKQVRNAIGGSNSRTRLMVLIRPRGGDFMYVEEEVCVMLDDIAACKRLGADGVVVGCLQPDGQVDAVTTATLVEAAQQNGLDVTFHRAFDVSRDLSEALDALIRMGIPRVLTSGGQASANQGAGVIAGLVKQAAGRISIMIGGGVTAANAATLLAETGAQELHSSAKRRHCSVMQYRPTHLSMCSLQPPNDFEWNCTDEAEVARLLNVVCSGP